MLEMAAHLMAPTFIRLDSNEGVSRGRKSIECDGYLGRGEARDARVGLLAASIIQWDPIIIESSKRMIDE